ncbi:bifunctional diguanylate cyclase/phosphodiesterase [Marichromatium bheemlicum]|uniref:EAL domain-containing protein n=1 Tax=Marichromatium bheemlicum TaxID=365339 RepID=A0ABX1IAS5_9GAMM|nr:EAL domain-containing protein [Marichromatium bheemlicum]NKN33297.1 EAL domain-containing protein [Marichromatium bheemlicum]
MNAIDPWVCLDALDCAIAVVDGDGACVYANRQHRSTLPPGPWAIPEARGEVLEQARQGVREVCRGHRAEFSLEYPLVLDGEPRWLRLSARRLDADGATWRALVAQRDVSAYHHVEQALALTQGQLCTVLDSSPDLIFFKDQEGRYLGCNRAFAALLGRDPEQIVGADDTALFPAETAARLQADDARVRACGQARRFDFWHCDARGGRRLFDVLKAPYQGADGVPFGVMGCGRDLTALHRSQTLLSEAQAMTGLGSWELELATGRVLWSAPLSAILGGAPGDCPATEQELLDLVEPADRAQVASALETARRGGEPGDIEYRVRRSSAQTPRWVRQRVRAVVGCDGEPVRLLGSVLDVTEDRQAQAALRHSEARYRALFEGAEEAMWIIDGADLSCLANPAAATLFGYDSAAELNDVHPSVLSPEFQANGRRSTEQGTEILAFLAAHGSACFEWLHRRRDSTTFPAEVQSRRIPLAARQLRVALIRDLSEQRRREDVQRLTSAVFENTAEGIMVTDAAGDIVAVNPAFTAITGYAAEQARGRNPRLLKSGRHPQDFYRRLWHALIEQGRWQGELWNRRRDGELYPQWMSINAVRNHRDEVVNYVAIFSDITERYRSAEEIEFLSNHDPLTGLPNARLLKQRLAQAVEQAAGHDQRLGVFYVDVDRYNEVIASHGHAVADTVLCVLGARLNEATGSGDLVARLSDDTFVIVTDVGEELSTASALAAHYLGVCCQPIEITSERQLTLSASAGGALYPGDGRDAAELLRHAASALLSAKRRGRRSIAFYRPEITAAAVERLALEEGLRTALAEEQFVVHYQPLVEPQQNGIHAAEALLRWQRGSELVMPGAFIDVIENSDLVVPVGRWVIEAVLRQMRLWREAGLPEIRVSVNVSEPQITAGGLAETIAELLERYDIPARLLHIELIERVLLHDPKRALTELERLRALGIGIALDDFGTGYSSLSYLTQFPVDCLKIDRSFVNDLATDRRSGAIVRAILSMARNLDICAVAEGVEDIRQQRILAAEGCNLIQGYLISRPVSANTLMRLLEAQQRARGSHRSSTRALVSAVG